jgi:hypothetical protein
VRNGRRGRETREGDRFVAARTPRFPRMLLAHLDRRRLGWAALEEPDGSGLVYVERPPAG